MAIVGRVVASSISPVRPHCGDRLAQLWIAQDEVDDLVLDTESGCAVFIGQFAIELDRVAEGLTDQLGVFGKF